MRRAVLASLLTFAACAEPTQCAWSQTTATASSFVDSVGVNLHLHYQDSAYHDLTKVRAALQQLHIHHVRDGLVNSNADFYYDALRALAKDHVQALMITDTSQTAALLREFPSRAPGVVEGLEAPNELDSGGGDWLQQEREALNEIRRALPDDSLFTVAPSLTRPESFAQLAAVPCSCTYGNLHNYFAGRNPGTAGWGDNGYGSYAWTLDHAHQAFGATPLMTTETGYINDPARQDGIPENIAGRYTVRLLLEQFLHGIRRTYLYELVDTDIPERGIHDRYGLLRWDFTPRPSFTAVAALMSLLQDNGAAAAVTRPASWSIEGGGASVHHLALRKADGTTVLLLWQEVSSYDMPTHTVLLVKPLAVTLQVTPTTAISTGEFAEDGSLLLAHTAPVRALKLSVGDRVTVAVLTPH